MQLVVSKRVQAPDNQLPVRTLTNQIEQSHLLRENNQKFIEKLKKTTLESRYDYSSLDEALFLPDGVQAVVSSLNKTDHKLNDYLRSASYAIGEAPKITVNNSAIKKNVFTSGLVTTTAIGIGFYLTDDPTLSPLGEFAYEGLISAFVGLVGGCAAGAMQTGGVDILNKTRNKYAQLRGPYHAKKNLVEHAINYEKAVRELTYKSKSLPALQDAVVRPRLAHQSEKYADQYKSLLGRIAKHQQVLEHAFFIDGADKRCANAIDAQLHTRYELGRRVPDTLIALESNFEK